MLKNELRVKQEQIASIQRSTKYTKLVELEKQVEIYVKEIQRYQELLKEEQNKPKIKPSEYQ